MKCRSCPAGVPQGVEYCDACLNLFAAEDEGSDDDDQYPYDSDLGAYDPDDDLGNNEPCGSCDWCGCNIYPEDCGADEGLCDQCAWHASLGEGTEDAGGDSVLGI